MLTIEKNIKNYLLLDLDQKLTTLLPAHQAQRFFVHENNDDLVDLTQLDYYENIHLHEDLSNTMVRKEFGEKLITIAYELSCEGYTLGIRQLYRPQLEQEEEYTEELERLQREHPSLSTRELCELINTHCISPYVCPTHTTGGAVDAYLIDIATGKEVDMGSTIYHHTAKAHLQCTEISQRARNARQLLLNLFLEEDCAPLVSEWWHFSYGDKIWAAFYNKPALYDAI